MAAPRGNRNAAKAKDWETALRRALAQHKETGALVKIAEKVVDSALEGNMLAIKEIGDRLDGKPAQAIDVGGSLDIRRDAQEFTDDELAALASGGSAGTAGETEGAERVN